VQALNIFYSEPMQRTLFTFLFMLLVIGIPAVQAEDSAPALPPPTGVSDTHEALETVEPPAAPQDEGLRGELSPPADDSNVGVYSTTREDGTKIEEYSHHGRVYMVKVTPPHGMPPYYLYDNNGDGQFERRLPGGNKRPSPPEWVIHRF